MTVPPGRKSTNIAIVICLLACACLGPASCASNTASRSLGRTTVKKLTSSVQKVVRATGAPGALVGVWAPGGTWTFVMGEADVKTGRPMELTDMVAIGGNTMTFVSTVVLQLVEAKALSLNDHLGKYNTQIPQSQSITIEELLNHTSGIYDYWEDPAFMKTVAERPEKEWTPREMVSVAASHPLYFAPGKGWHLSSTNYILLGMIVEKITGNTLGNEINSRIADRLNLKNTYLSALTMVEGPQVERAHGYTDADGARGLQDVTDNNPSCYWAAGAMASDVEDMGAYIKALATGELLTPQMQKKRLTWVDTKKAVGSLRSFYGLGIRKAGALIGHSGGVAGYGTAAYYLPGKDTSFFACITEFPTQDATADELVQDIARALYPDEFP